MDVELVTTRERALLHRVRQTLLDADGALLCVAFADRRGVGLLEKELDQRRGRRTRLLVTTVFGSSKPDGLADAIDLGVDVRVFNPAGQTFHPKVYLADCGATGQAIVGSANLTGGLATNHEAAVWMRGPRELTQLTIAWSWAEALWNDPRCVPFSAIERAAAEVFEPELYAFLQAAIARNPVFATLGNAPRPNRVVALEAGGLYVETERARQRGTNPFVPAWMFNLAWDYLKTHGSLTNLVLLNDLRVHRSTAVCAILARHPDVERVVGAGIELRLRGVAARSEHAVRPETARGRRLKTVVKNPLRKRPRST